MKIDLSWTKIMMGYLMNIPVHRVRNLIFTIILYARYKLWAKSLEHSVTNASYMMILINDVSKWNYMIETLKFDCDHNVFKAIWKHINVIENMQTLQSCI